MAIVSGSLLEFTMRNARSELTIDAEDPEIARLLAAMEQSALTAFVVGVTHDWRDWISFEPLERLAWANAALRFRAQEARRIALAQRGAVGYLLAASDSEGLEAADSAIADSAAVRIAHGRG